MKLSKAQQRNLQALKTHLVITYGNTTASKEEEKRCMLNVIDKTLFDTEVKQAAREWVKNR